MSAWGFQHRKRNLTVRKRMKIFRLSSWPRGLPGTGNPTQPFQSLPAALEIPDHRPQYSLRSTSVASRYHSASWRVARETLRQLLATSRAHAAWQVVPGRRAILPFGAGSAAWSRLRILSEPPWPKCSHALCCRAISGLSAAITSVN